MEQSLRRPSLSMVIVSYNTVDLLRDCLLSVRPQLGPQDEVIVVDNDSADGSAAMVAAEHPTVVLVASRENLGFGRANNRGFSLAKGDLVWMLNPDTRLTAGALEAAVAFMLQNPVVGMAGTALINPDGSPQAAVEQGYPGQRYAGSALGTLPGEIAWVMGASILARREVLARVGGFDERFFLYGEETDLCLRVRQAGWPIGFIESAVVMHYGGESERLHPAASVIEKKFRAEMQFYAKHYPQAAIRRIRSKNRLQAAWRLATLAPLRLLSPDDPVLAAKFTFYRCAWRFFGEAGRRPH